MQHIIIIEDDRIQLDIIGHMLSLDNYCVSTYSCSRQILEQLDDIQADLILIDLSLPDLDGFELCLRLREVAKLQDIPIVAFSADLSLNTKVRSNLSGFDGFIEKPFRTKEFRAQIAKYLNGNRISL